MKGFFTRFWRSSRTIHLLRPVRMHFCHDSAFGIAELPSADGWLLLDACWAIRRLSPFRLDLQGLVLVEPIINQWESAPPNDPPNYPAASWGPAAADSLLKRDGRAGYIVLTGGYGRGRTSAGAAFRPMGRR